MTLEVYTCLHRTNGKPEENPFEDEHEDWDDYPNEALVDNGEPGVPVRALYDYEGAEADELTFKQGMCLFCCCCFFTNVIFVGDVFEKLEDEDEQGWYVLYLRYIGFGH